LGKYLKRNRKKKKKGRSIIGFYKALVLEFLPTFQVTTTLIAFYSTTPTLEELTTRAASVESH
jgi:hypothetical protein